MRNEPLAVFLVAGGPGKFRSGPRQEGWRSLCRLHHVQ